MPLYAEGTTVPVESSRGEITGILAKHGVQKMGWQTGPQGDELLFELHGRTYRFTIAKPTMTEVVNLLSRPRTRCRVWAGTTEAAKKRYAKALALQKGDRVVVEGNYKESDGRDGKTFKDISAMALWRATEIEVGSEDDDDL